MPVTMTTSIAAKQFLDAAGRIVASAELLADEVVRRLRHDDIVQIDLRDVRGVSSSYFNILLQRVVPMTTVDGFSRRVQMLFDSTAQQQVFNRSFESIKRGAA